MTSLWYRDVTLGRQGAVVLLFFLVAQWESSTLVFAQTVIIPSISVSETYDSNVFYTPTSLLGPNVKPEDFITMLTPQLNIAHTGSLVRGSVYAGGIISKYLNNPSLDYNGINTGGVLDLKNAANKLSQRMTSLTVTGTYQFTPSASAFTATGAGTGIGGGYGGTSGGVLNNGLVTNRVSTNVYTMGVTGGYQLTRTTILTGLYSYNKISFGQQSGGVNNPLFDTVGNQGAVTISTQTSARDAVGATSTMSHYGQEQSGSSGQGSFTTIGETLNWSRRWTQRLTTSLLGGGIVTLPIESTTPGQSTKSQFAPTVGANISYASLSEGLRAAGSSPGPFDGLPSLVGTVSPGGIAAPGQFTTALTYNFSVYPSYAYAAGPTKTHVVGANVTGGITRNLTGQAGLNFSHGSTSTPATTFDSATLNAGLRYLIGPVLANLTYTWMYFSSSIDNTTPGQTTAGDNVYAFSKKMVMLSFSYAFTSQSFFRMDRFGSVGRPSAGEGTSGLSGGEPGSGASDTGPGNLRKE